jgi:hypothetical protein
MIILTLILTAFGLELLAIVWVSWKIKESEWLV